MAKTAKKTSKKKPHMVRAGKVPENLLKEITEYRSLNVVNKKMQFTVDSYEGKLPDMLLDFAQRYALEPRSIIEWADWYRVSRRTIYMWLDNPTVQQLIAEIKSDRNKYFRQKMLLVHDEAMNAYIEILRTPAKNAQERQVLLDAATAIMRWGSDGQGSGNTNAPIVNVNVVDSNKTVEHVASDNPPKLDVNIIGVEPSEEQKREAEKIKALLENINNGR